MGVVLVIMPMLVVLYSFFSISVLLDTGGESDSSQAVGHVR